MKKSDKYIYICWEEETCDVEKVYVGGGYYDTKATNKRLVTKRAPYAPYSPDMLAKAKQYLLEETPRDYQLNYRVEIDD